MTEPIQKIPVRTVLKPRPVLWLAAVATLATLLALLTKSIMDNPASSQDITVMDWIVGWDLPGLTTFFDAVSNVTHTQAGLIYGPLGVVFLLLLGKTRPAIVFAVVGVSIAVVVSMVYDYVSS